MNRTSIGMTWKLLVLSLLLALAAAPAAHANDGPPTPPSAMPPLPDLAFTTIHLRDHDELAVVNRGFGSAGPFVIKVSIDIGAPQAILAPGLAPAPIYGGADPTYLIGTPVPLPLCTAVRIDATNLVHESDETSNLMKNWAPETCGYLGL